MRHRLRHISTQIKVTLLIAVTILLFFLITIQCFSWIKAHWEEQVLMTAQKNIELISSEWTQLSSGIQAEATRLCSDTNITAYLSAPEGVLSDELLTAGVSSRLFDSAMSVDYANSLCVIKSKDEYVFRNLYRYYFSDQFVEQFLEKDVSPGFQIATNLNGLPFLLYVEPLYVPVTVEKTGYLLLYLDLATLEKLFAPLDAAYSGYALINQDAEILYQAGMDSTVLDLHSIEAQWKIDANNNDNGNSIVWDDDGVMIIHRFQRGQWTIVQNISRTLLFSDVNRTFHLMVGISGALSILLFICLRRIFAIYYRRVERLRATMSTVKSGTLSVRHQDDGTDELAQIGHHFNDMLNQIQELVANISLKEARLREAQLNVLRHQMNPHFLYNTLETIRMLAVLHNDGEINVITQDLSDILRYSLDESDQDTCLVGEEILMLYRYVRIQQARFPGRFTYTFDIDESIRSMRMSKFLLQPLLENAFKHGISATLKVSYLFVRGTLDNGHLSFTVSNTGVPMAPEILQALNNYIQYGKPIASKQNSGIGLRNVIDRIRLYFGDEGHVFIESNVESGTNITIQFPPL